MSRTFPHATILRSSQLQKMAIGIPSTVLQQPQIAQVPYLKCVRESEHLCTGLLSRLTHILPGIDRPGAALPEKHAYAFQHGILIPVGSG